MDFRAIPLAIPLKSPSPDCKSINIITPTVSPNIIEIKKESTLKKNEYEKENIKCFQEFNTQSRYHSYSPGVEHSSNIIKEKDDIIAYLRHIINIITENHSEKKESDSEYESLKNEVKILTIENEKLVNIIERNERNERSKGNEEWESRYNEYEERIK
jgi:hypothetical protein